jgi:nicotinate phosphoribosyltransferase
MATVKIYQENLALFTDLYELTMAYGYWKTGMAKKEAVFHLFFRRRPFQGSFAIAAGLETALNLLKNFRFEASDLAYLETLRGTDDRPLFEKPFLDYLSTFSLQCGIDAVPEGTPVFPYEPILRVQGPIIHAQILESLLLNIINFQSLIATKASRICYAARPDPVIEFGLRRAQGIDGALSASRAAFIGGCPSTSDVLAGKLFGIPVKGTHAHSWIMAFPDEEESFKAWGDVMPNNLIFLIDTYDSIKGAKKAIQIAKTLRQKNITITGVRLDSGDLAQLSIEVRKLLDEAGFKNAKIMASNELDEYLVADLKRQGAKIDLWGVGTHLVTGKEQPALDGVYKLSAIRDSKTSPWRHKVKISEQLVKVTNPGLLQIRRYTTSSGYEYDILYDQSRPLPSQLVALDPFDPMHVKKPGSNMHHRDLLIPVMRQGKVVYDFPSLPAIQKQAQDELEKFHPAIRRFLNPQPYFVGLEKTLYDLKLSLIEEIKKQ